MISSAGGEPVMIKGTRVYLIRNPSVDLIRTLLAVQGVNRICPAPDQFVNLSSLTYVALVRKIFSGFFKVHTYAAYTDETHLADFGGPVEDSSAKGKRKAPDDQSGSRKKKPGESSRGSDDDSDEPEPEMDIDSTGQEGPSGFENISWAYPNGNVDNIGWGDPESLGSTGGLWLPFVIELLDYDSKTVVETIVKHFLGCLGSNTESCRQMVDNLRSAWGVVCKTNLGKVFSHMAKCIDLGIQAQARVFPVFSGDVYEGCVLAGYGFTLVIDKRVYKSLSPSELAPILSSARRSSEAIKAIAVLSGSTNADWISGNCTFTSLMSVKKELALLAITERARDEILKIAGKLPRGSKWQLNPNSLIKAFDLLSHSSWETLPEDLPIGPTMLFETDVVSVVWSCFGEMAPSTFFAGQASHPLGSAKFPKHIGFRQAVLPEAIGNIKEVLRTRQVTIPSLNRRSALHKDRVFEGSNAVNVIAAMMKACDISPTKAVGNTSNTSGGPVDNLLVDI